MANHEKSDMCERVETEKLEEKARQLGAFNATAITTGNTIVIFSMLILQQILEQQSRNPINNLGNIITISNSIAMLNTSIKI